MEFEANASDIRCHDDWVKCDTFDSRHDEFKDFVNEKLKKFKYNLKELIDMFTDIVQKGDLFNDYDELRVELKYLGRFIQDMKDNKVNNIYLYAMRG